jgi:hypothetical protein
LYKSDTAPAPKELRTWAFLSAADWHQADPASANETSGEKHAHNSHSILHAATQPGVDRTKFQQQHSSPQKIIAALLAELTQGVEG